MVAFYTPTDNTLTDVAKTTAQITVLSTATYSNWSVPLISSLYTMSECVYYVNTSSNQRALYGIMGTSLIINFGLLIWWLRLYLYKRKHFEQDADDEDDDEDVDKLRDDVWQRSATTLDRPPLAFTHPTLVDASTSGRSTGLGKMSNAIDTARSPEMKKRQSFDDSYQNVTSGMGMSREKRRQIDIASREGNEAVSRRTPKDTTKLKFKAGGNIVTEDE